MPLVYTHKRGRLVMFCKNCSAERPFFFLTSEEKFSNHCPKCNQYLFDRRCFRCGHEWIPKHPGHVAGVCPKCKSPYWNRERCRGRTREDWRDDVPDKVTLTKGWDPMGEKK